MSGNRKSYGNLIKVVWKFDRGYVCILPLVAAGRMWKGFLFMIFPRLIIDAMLLEESQTVNGIQGIFGFSGKEMAYFWALVMGLLFLAGSLVSDRVERYHEQKIVECKEWMALQLQGKLMRTEYARLEEPEFMDRYQKAFSVYTLWQADLKRGMNALIQTASGALTMIAAAWLLFSLNWWIALIVAMVVVLSSSCNAWAVKRMSELLMSFAPNVRKVGYFLGELQERKYAREIRVYHMQDWLGNHAEGVLHSILSPTVKAVGRQISAEAVSITAGALQEGGAYLYIGWMALKGRITLGAVTMYVSAINNFASAMKDAMENIVVLKEVETYYRAFQDFLNAKDGEEKECISGQGTKLSEEISVEFDHVWFRYSEGTPWILKDVCLTIEAGEKISLVGDNGAGKTTLVKLLLGLFEPTSGAIRINGRELKDYGREAYWKKIGVVFQDFKTLAFTIKENVAAGEREPDTAQLERALQKSGLWEKVQSLPEKENTYLGKEWYEQGTEISGGEQQKLAIAQMCYKDAPVMILDEPTANLSPMEEYRIFHQFYDLSEGKTVVFISHRMSSCRLCDKIVVLSEGSICEEGTHEELIGQEGLYAEMFRAQAQYYELA